MAFGFNLWNMNDATSEAYKNGYADCEKKYKQLEKNYDVAIKQLKKLGYEIGEDENVIKNAAVLSKFCKSNVGCDGCCFYLKKTGNCSLSGDNPSGWKVC